MCMRASGASELRKFWHFYILKLLFLLIFCRYIRYFVGTNDMFVGLHVPTNLGGGGFPPPPLATLMICSRKCLKSFVICARSTHDVRDVRKIFVKPQADSVSLENISRMSREISEVRPIISRPIPELVHVLLFIRLPFATINLRMSRSIPELFASYTRTKTDAFRTFLTKVLRTRHSHLTSGRYKAHGRGVVRNL